MITSDNENLNDVFSYIRINACGDFLDWLFEDNVCPTNLAELDLDECYTDALMDRIRVLSSISELTTWDLAAIACATHGHVYAAGSRLWYDARGEPYPKLSPAFRAQVETQYEEMKSHAP